MCAVPFPSHPLCGARRQTVTAAHHPLHVLQAVLRQGGLVAVLSFLDFFQTGVQRVAVATAAAMCRGLSGDSVEAVQSAVPILTNILQYEVRAA